MQKVIYKFELKIDDVVKVEMPKGAKILTVQNQNDNVSLWALCDKDAEKEIRIFSVIGTGHDFNPVAMEYIGTFQTMGGAFVGHLFEITK